MPLSTIYSFQKSVGVTVHMFTAIAKVLSLSLTTYPVLLEGGDSLVGSIHTRALWVHAGVVYRLPCFNLRYLLLFNLISLPNKLKRKIL